MIQNYAYLKIGTAVVVMCAIFLNFAFVLVAPPETMVPYWYVLLSGLACTWPTYWSVRTLIRHGE